MYGLIRDSEGDYLRCWPEGWSGYERNWMNALICTFSGVDLGGSLGEEHYTLLVPEEML